MKQKLSIWIQGSFYVIAGVNHFYDPDFYVDLIPPFFSNPFLINVLAGIAEIVLGVGLLFNKTRAFSAYSVVVMLLAFIPSHVYFIQIGSCVDTGLCVPEWVGWLRLVLIHPLLLLWAWSTRHRKI